MRPTSEAWGCQLQQTDAISVIRSGQVKRYGSALGFHPRGKGSTPFTRTDARVVQQPRRSARIRQTQVRFLSRALMLRKLSRESAALVKRTRSVRLRREARM